MKNKKYLLIAILIIAAFLRLWKLGNIPPSLTPDEASLGYNAYSILKTGRDEYGKILPVIFKSFGDYKPGLYVYLAVHSILVFGLNEFAVRLPSALAGIISVWLIYLIVKKFFQKENLALISAFIAAVTPWLIYFSRGAWEVNVSLTLTLAGIYFFLKFLEKERYIIHSAVFFALTLVCYQGAKLSTGIVVLLLVALYFKKVIKIQPKKIIISLVLGLLISFPILLSLVNGQSGRLEVFSVFSYRRPAEYLMGILNQGEEKVGNLSYYLFHSEVLNFKRGILGRYFNHFSGRFLFFEGDWSNPRHSAPYSGMLLLSDIILLLAGVYALIRTKLSREHWFIILWLFLAPLPSILSRDQVHAVRSINMAIPLIVVLAFGLTQILETVSRNKFKIILYLLGGGIYLAGFLYFIDAYFVHVSKHDSQLWEYGYKQVVQIVTPIQQNYKTIKVQQSFAQPYIYFLFYQKYDPAKYQKNATLTVADSVKDVGYVDQIDNIKFVPIDWSVNRGEEGTLFVADSIRIPPEDSKDGNLFKVIAEIKYLNGRDMAFRIIEVK
jgi:4-amino-4-deoxy-L-arabinose transferase-like glycosyltransferase